MSPTLPPGPARPGPLRTGSLIVTVYGDAILPRGGALALSSLLPLMARLGAAEGMVRTAVSRLGREGLLRGGRAGRRSFYALTEHGRAEFAAAVPRIYGPLEPDWDGRLRLAFPEAPAARAELEALGFARLAPWVLVGVQARPAAAETLAALGPPALLARLARRAWPLEALAGAYRDYLDRFAPLAGTGCDDPLEAMARRTLVLHAWRRIVLRDPRLPAALLPADWPGHRARALCLTLYAGCAAASERWLDLADDGRGRLPPGPDPLARFGDRVDP